MKTQETLNLIPEKIEQILNIQKYLLKEKLNLPNQDNQQQIIEQIFKK
jgi:hypothetical protein